MALASLAFVACDDDSYNDWADPQNNPNTTEDQRIATTFSVAAADAISFESLTETDTIVKVFTPTLTSKGAQADAVAYKIILGNATEETEVFNDGMISTSVLKSSIETEFGKAPTPRELAATVVAYTTYGTIVSRETADVTITATLVAPVIEDVYYYVGTANDWIITDKTYAFKRADVSVSKYDDPVFTVTIPASVDAETGERVDEWFKIATPAAAEGEGNWNAVIGGTVDGATPLEATALEADASKAQAFKMPADDGAISYQITLNMMDYTVVVTPISYKPYIYVPGNGQGWDPGTAAALACPAMDGVYTGYAYIDGEFKFTKNRDWSEEYNSTNFSTWAEGFAGAETSTNIASTTAGVYYMNIDVATGTFGATLISRMGIVGPAQAGGWNDDTEMTWNADENAYVWTGDLAADELKFRANNGWDINLGGDMSDLTAGGDNIKVSEAGEYTVKLFALRTSSEKMYCTFTKN